MRRIGFVGLGNMGGPMAKNLVAKGFAVKGFDLSEAALGRFTGAGGAAASSAQEAAGSVDVVVTMLPAAQHVRMAYLGDDGLLAAAAAGTRFIDCSTIDVAAAREVAAAAAAGGFGMIDAPVSGGVGGAGAGTLTFMVGGAKDDLEAVRPALEAMGRNIVHAGDAGAGQAAKICNNMILGISMIAVSEAFNLADSLGIDRQRLFDVVSTASGQCWSLTTYCPVPGPVPTSPANRDYAPGFTAAMMLKDLRLAAEAASATGVATPLGSDAREIYEAFVAAGGDATDFSGVIRHLRDR